MRTHQSVGLFSGAGARFVYVLVTLGILLLGVSVLLTGRPPWWFYLRSRELGWVPARWEQPLAGHWTFRFEQSSFLPCPGFAAGMSDSTIAWWANTSHVRSTLRSLVWRGGRLMSDTTVFVAWFADVSPQGEYGHLGAYSREIGVTDIATLRPSEPDDCSRARQDRMLFAEY